MTHNKHLDGAGFTLIELVVVMAIVALLGALSVNLINLARLQLRETKRKVDITNIASLITSYRIIQNQFPLAATPETCIGSPGNGYCISTAASSEDWNAANGFSSWEDLGEQLGVTLPVDPINTYDPSLPLLQSVRSYAYQAFSDFNGNPVSIYLKTDCTGVTFTPNDNLPYSALIVVEFTELPAPKEINYNAHLMRYGNCPHNEAANHVAVIYFTPAG